ncbi:MAG TPA: iron chelate uptake ABC transporter family permease subunit, partial [Baekduia sp.]|nr:iron chelate uptake ABC transporter family permease subunit [Baekduia sp.]
MLLIASVVLVAAAIASLAFGAVHLAPGEVINTLLGKTTSGISSEIVNQLRLPRTVEAIVVGAALGLSGVLLQGSLGNPLASPDIVGITGGAGFGAVLILLAFPDRVALLPGGAPFRKGDVVITS